MDSTKIEYSSFLFEWTVKSTSYQIWYRQAFNISEIDEIFCSIINLKGKEISVSDLGSLLGFNLNDLAEIDILNTYLNSIAEYNLITINQKTIRLTEFGQEAIQSKLKYKYFFASTELFENQTAIGEKFDFSFKSQLDLNNSLSQERKITQEKIENPELIKKLQFQLFENDKYKGEVIEIFNTKPQFNYKSFFLNCKTFELNNSFQLSIDKSGANKADIQTLIELPENEELKNKLIRTGMYHHVLDTKTSITTQDIETYIDLWNWNELAGNQKVDWNDKRIFKLFLENGNGNIWGIISEKAPIETIKSVIQEYAEYWHWTALTNRFDNDYIKAQLEYFNWDLEELSYKDQNFVQDIIARNRVEFHKQWLYELYNERGQKAILDELIKSKEYNSNYLTDDQILELANTLTYESLMVAGWDWNYLSKNLSDNFIEIHIDEFPWDFYSITEHKSEILRNLFRKKGQSNYTDILISKPWNWQFISREFDSIFLFNNLEPLAAKVDWNLILEKFFTNEEIAYRCFKEATFKTLLSQHLPDNFVIAHQKYRWTLNLIDFFEELNLIQWETKSFIKGFDTNENIEWTKSVFLKYHNRITTEMGFLNVSRQISDYRLIEEFPDFVWKWEGISQNKKLISNIEFVENAFVCNISFSDNLHWNEILLHSAFDITFWNKNLGAFHEKTDREKQIQFWKLLTRLENQDYILAKNHFPWDWSFITEKSSEEIILSSFDDEDLFEKWDWKIATRKLHKDIILDNLIDFARFIDWKYLINEVFTIENELALDKRLPVIAACLSVVNDDMRKDIWKDLTAKFPFETLFPIVEATYQLDILEWEWDWSFISNHKLFPTDISTLNQFRQKINWTVLSESDAIKRKFNPNNWSTGREWFSNIDHYLQTFEDNWDWQVLSHNQNINHNRFLLEKYRNENWDWDYLTEFGGFLTKQKMDNEKYLKYVIKRFPKINFEILSRRKDISIDSKLILSTQDKNWDWQILSENEEADISFELILELSDKNWNWKAISKRKNIEFTNEMLLKFIVNDWDWAYLSNNPNLEFNVEFIEKTKEKDWDWKAISRHKTFLPTIEILTLTEEFDLDWKHLSQHSSLNPTKELLAKFENKWHWPSITENSQIDFSDIGFIERFADKWNWRFISKSAQLRLSKQILHQFKGYLEWDLISSNTNIDFTKEIIQEFKQFWNWTRLKENKRVEELLGSYISEEISKSAILNFLDRIEQQWSGWKGSIYHFSHIDNAVEIIKNRKIQSRNKANIKSDAAGNVVHRRGDAHDYARFYFRPHTPTQFYNEFLGKNKTDGYDSKNYGWVSWYEKARGLGFPKCPIPIFFRFSIKEVLFKSEKQCCISNGNMQANSTQFNAIGQMLGKFNFEYLYSDMSYDKEHNKKYMNFSQQEFLVKDELVFDGLSDFEIVCPSETDRILLINLLGQEHKDIFTKIVVDRRYYNNENPRIRIEEDDSKLNISTNFNGSGYFILTGTSTIRDLVILSGNVNKIDNDKIIFSSSISLGNVKQKMQVNFIDESNRNWFVYAKGKIDDKESSKLSASWRQLVSATNYDPFKVISLLKLNGFNDVYSFKIRHYQLEFHTLLVCQSFEKYFVSSYNECLSLEMFRTLLILHDIGKTKAFIEGDKNRQYFHTEQIIRSIWNELGFSQEELYVILALLTDDILGEYYQGKLNSKEAKSELSRLGSICSMQLDSFFKLYMIYYQCDTASYTADAGGIKFLEHLFEYKNGQKVFDEEEGLLKMSHNYWEMYKQLKNEIEDVN